MSKLPPMSRAQKAERTHQAILAKALRLAAHEGLEGLTIGTLAVKASLSKSGLFAHFGSKEDLQLAVVEFARQRFVEEVVSPALLAPRGLPRLLALCDGWLSHAEREVSSGACFFAGVLTEFDQRPGPVRTRLVAVMSDWMTTLEK
jgi:AcrR family transcriptional regulator